MENYFLDLLLENTKIQKIFEINLKTEVFGLQLSEEDAKLLIEGRKNNLHEQQWVEFGVYQVLPLP